MNSFKKFDYYMKYSTNYASKKLEDKWKIVEQLFEENIINKTVLTQKIPSKIHQIWIGKNIPSQVQELQNTIQQANKMFTYKLWNEDEILSLDFKNKDIFKQATNPGQKSDIARYAILEKYGGIYVDSDFRGLKSFDKLLYLDFFTGVSYDKEPTLFNGLIGTTPGNCFIKELNNITDIKDGDGMDVITSTGPWFMTKKFFNQIKNAEDLKVAVLPVGFFYCYPNFTHDKIFGDNIEKYMFEESICIHLWHSLWN
jgi:mannosyltransferase OCH1-like enzyme